MSKYPSYPSNTDKIFNYVHHNQLSKQIPRQKSLCTGNHVINSTKLMSTHYSTQLILYEHIFKGLTDPQLFNLQQLIRQIQRTEIRSCVKQLHSQISYNKSKIQAFSNKISSLNDIFRQISDRKLLFRPNSVKLEDNTKQVGLYDLREVIKLNNQCKIMYDIIAFKGKDSNQYSITDYASPGSIPLLNNLKKICSQYSQTKLKQEQTFAPNKNQNLELKRQIEGLKEKLQKTQNQKKESAKIFQIIQQKQKQDSRNIVAQKGISLTKQFQANNAEKIINNPYDQIDYLKKINAKQINDHKKTKQQNTFCINALKMNIEQSTTQISNLKQSLQQAEKTNKSQLLQIQKLTAQNQKLVNSNNKLQIELKNWKTITKERKQPQQKRNKYQYISPQSQENSKDLSQKIKNLEKQLIRLRQINTKLNGDKLTLQSILKHIQQQNANLKNILHKKDFQDDDIIKQKSLLEKQIQKLQKKLISDHDLADVKYRQLQKDNLFAEQRYRKLFQQKKQADEQIKSFTAKISQIELQNKDLGKILNKYEAIQSRYVKDYSAAQQTLKDQIVQKDKDIQRLKYTIKQAEDKSRILSQEVQSLKRINSQQQKQNKSLKERLFFQDSQINRMQFDVQKLKQQKSGLQTKIYKAENQLINLRRASEQLQNNLRLIQSQKNEAQTKRNIFFERIQILKAQKDSIQSSSAHTIQQLNRDLRSKQQALLNAQKTIQKQISDISRLQSQNAQLDVKILIEKQQIDKIKDSYDIAKKEIQTSNRLLQKQQAQNKILKKQIQLKVTQIFESNLQIKRLIEQIEALKNKINNTESQLNDIKTNNNSLSNQLEILKSQKNNIEYQLNSTVQKLKKELKLKQTTITNSQQTIQKQKSDITSLEFQKRHLNDKVLLQRQQIRFLRSLANDLQIQQAIISDLNTQIIQQKEYIQRLKQAEQNMQAYLNVHKDEIEKLRDIISNMKLDINKKDSQNKKSRVQKASLEQKIKKNQSIQQNLRHRIQQLQKDKKEKNQILNQKIYGLTNELQSVHQKYNNSILYKIQNQKNENISFNQQIQTQRKLSEDYKAKCKFLQQHIFILNEHHFQKTALLKQQFKSQIKKIQSHKKKIQQDYKKILEATNCWIEQGQYIEDHNIMSCQIEVDNVYIDEVGIIFQSKQKQKTNLGYFSLKEQEFYGFQ